MSGSLRGGSGRTDSIIIAAAACKMLGLPYVVVSCADENSALEKALGKSGFVVLDTRTPELLRSSFSAVKQEARETGALILPDMPAAADIDSAIEKTIRESRILECCEPLMMIASFRPNDDELYCAYRAIEIFKPTKVLLRTFDSTRSSPELQSFGEWENLKCFPLLKSNRTESECMVLRREDEYKGLPPVPQLAEYLAGNAATLGDVALLDVEGVVKSIGTAAESIYRYLLADITEVVADQQA